MHSKGQAATAEYRSLLGLAPEVQAAQAEFQGAGVTPQGQAAQIAQTPDVAAAQRTAAQAERVMAPDAAQAGAVTDVKHNSVQLLLLNS